MRAVCRLTGLTPDTLRAWERRYRAVEPERLANGRRVYRPDEVQRLRLLADAVRAGHAIGRIADLADDELRELCDETGPAREGATGTGTLVEGIEEAVRRFDAEACARHVRTALAILPPEVLIYDVLSPVFAKVGAGWERGELTIAHERLLSATVRRFLFAAVTTFEPLSARPVAMLATLSGEQHEFGILLAALAATSRGVAVSYLGVDIPAEEIARLGNELSPRAVVVGMVLRPNSDALAQLRRLRLALHPSVEIWLGGAGAQAVDGSRLPTGVERVATLREYEARLGETAQT